MGEGEVGFVGVGFVILDCALFGAGGDGEGRDWGIMGDDSGEERKYNKENLEKHFEAVAVQKHREKKERGERSSRAGAEGS